MTVSASQFAHDSPQCISWWAHWDRGPIRRTGFDTGRGPVGRTGLDAGRALCRANGRLRAQRLPGVDAARLAAHHRRLDVGDADLLEVELDGPAQVRQLEMRLCSRRMRRTREVRHGG